MLGFVGSNGFGMPTSPTLGLAKHCKFSPRGPAGWNMTAIDQSVALEFLFSGASGLPGSPRYVRWRRAAGWQCASSPKSPKVFIPYASEGPSPTGGGGRAGMGRSE